MSQDALRDLSAGALVGCALGDAIGELAFVHPEREALMRVVTGADSLVYTDDTAMAVELARALAEDGRVDRARLGERFAAAHEAEPWRGYGPGPPKIFRTAAHRRQPCHEIAALLHGGQGSLGNGAAMRVAPAGVAYRDTAERADAARTSATITHAHPVGQDAAALQAHTVALAVTNALAGEPLDGERAARELVRAAHSDEMHRKLAIVAAALSDGTPPDRVAHAIGRSVAAHESVPFAIYAFLRAPTDFEAVLDCAILNGGDRDTLGAMAAAACGAHIGLSGLPAPWRERAENGETLVRLGHALADRFPV